MRVFSSLWMLPLLLAGTTRPEPPSEIVALTTASAVHPRFAQVALTESLRSKILRTTWHAGCPVGIEDLELLSLSYWDFNGASRDGLLLVNRTVADEVMDVFRKLYEHGFLIESMQPVEDFDGSDNRSMEANNTSAFNCRDVTGKPGRFSNHSWGRAIDINPLTNPMLLRGTFLPPAGERYKDRNKAWAGSILDGSFIVKTFRAHGWTWGGDWKDPDYQHFEKPDPSRP
jgi:hypothetical protein